MSEGKRQYSLLTRKRIAWMAVERAKLRLKEIEEARDRAVDRFRASYAKTKEALDKATLALQALENESGSPITGEE